MNKIVSAAEANRNFSKLLNELKDGTSYTITNHGKIVGHLNPPADDAEARKKAFDALMKRLRSQPIRDIGPWTREELYERDSK
jgi:prevent-host-death family protein